MLVGMQPILSISFIALSKVSKAARLQKETKMTVCSFIGCVVDSSFPKSLA